MSDATDSVDASAPGSPGYASGTRSTGSPRCPDLSTARARYVGVCIVPAIYDTPPMLAELIVPAT